MCLGKYINKTINSQKPCTHKTVMIIFQISRYLMKYKKNFTLVFEIRHFICGLNCQILCTFGFCLTGSARCAPNDPGEDLLLLLPQSQDHEDVPGRTQVRVYHARANRGPLCKCHVTEVSQNVNDIIGRNMYMYLLSLNNISIYRI